MVSATLRNNCDTELTPVLSVTVFDLKGAPVTSTVDRVLTAMGPKEVRAIVEYVQLPRTTMLIDLTTDRHDVLVDVKPLSEGFRPGPTPIGTLAPIAPTLVVRQQTSISLQAATERVKREGYVVQSTGTYLEQERLRVLVGVRTGSADTRDQRAFFFLGNDYLGTDTFESSAQVGVVGQSRDTVSLAYTLYKPTDAMCCPTGGQALVRFFWNGSNLVPLDPIPSSDQTAPLSRR